MYILIFVLMVSLVSAVPVKVENKNIELTEIQDNLFTKIITDADGVDRLLDATMIFQGSEYDIEEILPVNIEVDLDKGYENDVKYYYIFSETIDLTKATQLDPLEIKFLGKTLKIVGVTTDSITGFVGENYPLDSGDTFVVDGKPIKLVRVGSGGAIVVDVDGVTETIKSEETKNVNNVNIFNLETYYNSNNQAASAAEISVGEFKTYKNGDSYNSDWNWVIGNLNEKSATIIPDKEVKGPFIGVKNKPAWKDLDSENCFGLPNDYLDICSLDISSYFVEETVEEPKKSCVASNEICDGVDNDCDDKIDEDLTMQCGETDLGICSFGTESCVNGKWSGCNAALPKEKDCSNNLDNNCDGSIDACCGECSYKDECLGVEERADNSYCSKDLNLEFQKDLNEECSNNYECLTNNCEENICKEKTIVKVIVNWFKVLFG